ncbi:MAG: alpha/beta hydrolase [Aeromicrobium sp.]
MYWKRWRTRLAGLTRFGYRAGIRSGRLLIPGRQGPMEGAYQRAVLHDTFSLRARLLQRAARLVAQPVLRFAPINGTTIKTARSFERVSARGPRSRFVEPIGYTLGGVRVESMTHRWGPSSNMTILYFHGGGFMSGGIESHRRMCETLARFSGANVISVDYVQLPEGTVADSVQDAINAYAGLLDMTLDPDKIVVAGDSAGGYLAMKVAELATRRELLPPAAVLCFSPMLSLDPERHDKAVERIHPINDAYLPPKRLHKIRAMWNPQGSVIEGFAAPLHASAYIKSPVFFTAVEDEILRPEIEAMSMLLADKGIEVETHIWRKQVHAFPVLADFLPESRHALKLAAAFARIAVGDIERVVHVEPEAPEVPTAFEPLAEDELGETVWIDEKTASESFVDGETLVGEVVFDEPADARDFENQTEDEDDIIDGELVDDKPGTWYPASAS